MLFANLAQSYYNELLRLERYLHVKNFGLTNSPGELEQCSSARRNFNSEPVLGTQDKLAQQGEVLATIDRFDFVFTQNRRYDCLFLQNGELLSYAVAWSGTEGDVREGMTSGTVFWQEVVRIELLRFRKDAWIAMKGVGHDNRLGSGRYQFTT